jgi:MoaA/NifB/PqqE/SkfB family radical SAM enzyme
MFHPKLIELEITADCNAQCPSCARTKRGMKLTGNNSLTLKDIQYMFQYTPWLKGKNISLCGTLGDPIVNPECLDICEWLGKQGARVGVSTNAGYNSAEWWSKLAVLDNVYVSFAVDGFRETNHIYRVNTKFNIIERNMTAYANAGGRGVWTYVLFDHNKHEVESALEFATNLGLEFNVRGGGRNATAKQHTPRKGAEVELVTAFNTDLVQEHVASQNSPEQIQSLLPTISCRHLNQSYLFVGSDMRLYPCCHLYAYTTAGGTEYIRDLPEDWNCLRTHTLFDIIKHDSFTQIKAMWSPYHKRYVPRCFQDCGNKGVYQDFNKPITDKAQIKSLLDE